MSCVPEEKSGPREREGMSGSSLSFPVRADRDVWMCSTDMLEQFWEHGKLRLWAKPNPQWDQQILTLTFPGYTGQYCL